MKQSKFLSLKEFVIVLLLACVETAIGLVVTMPFAANLQLVYFLAPGLAGLINGMDCHSDVNQAGRCFSRWKTKTTIR